MPPSLRKNSDIQVDEFIRELENISEQVALLLHDLKEGEINFAGVSAEFRIMCERVAELSDVLYADHNGHPSLLTRVTLLEQKGQLFNDVYLTGKFADLENKLYTAQQTIIKLEEHKKLENNIELTTKSNIEVANHNGKWAVRAGLLTSFIALAGVLFLGLLQHCK